jgi:uncharacterized protein Yka (UPF0111/DUF47 family)
MTTSESEPLRIYAKETAERLSTRLSLHERLLIADRILTSDVGFLAGFGKWVATLSVQESRLQPEWAGYKNPSGPRPVNHPVYGLLRATGFSEISLRSFVERTRNLHSSLREAVAKKKKSGAGYEHGIDNSIVDQQRRLIEGFANLGEKFYAMWKFNVRNSAHEVVGDSFEIVFDQSNPREDLKSYRSGYYPLTVLRGIVPKLRVEKSSLQQSENFVAWLEAKPAREQYAQLLATLATERMAEVINSRNQGRLFNRGEVLVDPYKERSLLRKTVDSVKAIGSDKSARNFMDQTSHAIRQETKATGYELGESLIYSSQLAFHKAPDKVALYLLWVDPNFEAYKEHAELHLAAATLLEESLRKQSERAQTLRSQVSKALEAGKLDWALEQDFVMTLSDFGKTEDLLAQVKETLERFDEYAQTTMNDQEFASASTRESFAAYKPKLEQALKSLNEKSQTDFKALSETVHLLESVEHEIDSYGRSGAPPEILAALARRLW